MLMLKLLFLDLKKSKFGSLFIIFLIACSVALSIAVSISERAFREGSTNAAEKFDLIIGASGSEIQLALSTVFLQPTKLNFIDYAILNEIKQNPNTAWAAPLTFGDYFQDMPIIGTDNTFIEKIYPELPQQQLFHQDFEAIVGADSGLKIGDKFSPLHVRLGENNHHQHNEIKYHVIGILPKQHNIWDRAIFVPIKNIWQIHQHSDIPQEREHKAVSAIIVKPKSFAGAYQLRSQYKTEQTQALFPAEVLVRVHAILGDSKQILLGISIITQILVTLALLMTIVLYLRSKQHQIAAWRIFGAPRTKIVLLIWSTLFLIITCALMLGTLGGIVFANLVAHYISQNSGFALPVYFSETEAQFLATNLLVAMLIALIPSFLIYRQTSITILKNIPE